MFEFALNLATFLSSHLDEDNEVDNIFNGSDSLQRRFIRSATDNNHFDFPPPPNDLNKDGVTAINKPVKDDDSIFGEDSEHVDDIPSGNAAQIQRTNSITFNIRQGKVRNGNVSVNCYVIESVIGLMHQN